MLSFFVGKISALGGKIQAIGGQIDAVGGKVDVIGAEMARLKSQKRRRHGAQYADAKVAAVREAMVRHEESSVARNSENTRRTLSGAFEYSRRLLESVGIATLEQFRKIKHALDVRAYRTRLKELDAHNHTQGDAASRRVTPQGDAPSRCVAPATFHENFPTNSSEFGIISNVTGGTSNTIFSLALAIVGAMAASLHSDAASQNLRGGVAHSQQGRVAASSSHSARGTSAAPQGLLGTSDTRQKLTDSKSINSSTLPTGIKTLKGRVVSVADGDTITIIGDENTQYKIRLNAIDAPEKSQDFGQKSKQQLSNYVFGKDVTVKWKSKDKYGRVLGTVFVGNTDINLQMVRDGFAHHYKRFDNSPAYAAAETEARQNRRGLWSDPNPIQPEDYRHRGTSAAPSDWGKRRPAASEQMETRRPAASSEATNLPPPESRVEYRAGNAMPVGSRTAAPVNSTWPDTGFWLSTNSNKRHNRKCENYRKTRGYPCSSSEGTPCGKCGG
jgi:endonuclease YncB( thermonuclease family)